jgi:hypothetical protein
MTAATTMPITGRCYCGAVSMRATQAPQVVTYCHCIEYLPGQVYVALGLIDQAARLAPQVHAHEQQRLPWLHIDDGIERFAQSSRSRLNACSQKETRS